MPKRATDGLQEALEAGATVIHVLHGGGAGGTNSEDLKFHTLKGKIGRIFFQPKPWNQSNQLTPDRFSQRGRFKDQKTPNQVPPGSGTGQSREEAHGTFCS